LRSWRLRHQQLERLIQINASAGLLRQNYSKATARMPSRFHDIPKRPNMSAPDDTTSRVRRKRMEIFAFLFLTAIVMPVLAVGTVGSYGLGVWIYQVFAGPPGPPSSPH
jgi:nitrate reductase NapE